MGSVAALHARHVIANVERVLAIELLVATQALDERIQRTGADPGTGVGEARARVRARVLRLAEDREPGPDIEAATDLVRTGALADLVG